jgi:hypothetical protein
MKFQMGLVSIMSACLHDVGLAQDIRVNFQVIN